MASKAIYCIILMLAGFSVKAQLSPGKLSDPHKHLEGIGNCTQCHVLGKKVSEAKCLECHSFIKSIVDKDRGYHASSEVRTKECVECHSDHHGLKFEMIRFNEDAFDHDLTGYALDGAHDRIECRDCHQADNIIQAELKKREDTYLGLDNECLSCHTDFHQGTLSNDCLSCHDFQKFRPAPGFDHYYTEYPLEGQHVEVDCNKCHETSTRNGKSFQEFSGVAFSDCNSCHTDPHSSQLPGSCSSCHHENSFNSWSKINTFNHTLTDFVLKGRHTETRCFDCHNQTSDVLSVFQDRTDINEDNCVVCHEDVHQGKFGPNCIDCHSETSFYDLKDMNLFDHDLTAFPLEGLHVEVDCRQCHQDKYTDPLDFSACFSCHADYHEGEFWQEEVNPDCKECHSVQEGFAFSFFDLERHEKTTFPLEGAHMATPCFDCHLTDDKWHFRNIGVRCSDCHVDFHKGYISESYYPDSDCRNCHQPEAWSVIDFDHISTQWPLDGAHKEVNCRECHFEDQHNSTKLIQMFNTLDNKCTQCHENIHGDQFDVDGITDCEHCHDVNSWYPGRFDHFQTSFPLEGKHSEITCQSCHVSYFDNNTEIIQFKIESFECIDCHQ